MKNKTLPPNLKAKFKNLKTIPIKHQTWEEYKITNVKASVKYFFNQREKAFFLYYQIKEPAIKAEAKKIRGEVWKDSCVEFFISFNKGKNYYNIEINPTGARVMDYREKGPKDERLQTELKDSSLRNIKVYSTMGTKPFKLKTGEISWEMIVIIPIICFEYTKINAQKINNCIGNFYKCGDDLPKPHFISAFPIDHPTPDFHRPEFFKPLNLQIL